MPKPAEPCKHDGCKASAAGGKGYCGRHYAAWKRGALPKSRYKTCRVEGCHKRVTGRGRCEEHFARDYPGKRAPQSGEASAPPAGSA
jgi:hypothetical protein